MGKGHISQYLAHVIGKISVEAGVSEVVPVLVEPQPRNQPCISLTCASKKLLRPPLETGNSLAASGGQGAMNSMTPTIGPSSTRITLIRDFWTRAMLKSWSGKCR